MNHHIFPVAAQLLRSGVGYKIWAPEVRVPQVEIVGSDGALLRSIPMEPADEGYFTCLDAQGGAGDRYRFRLNEEQAFPDPFSRWQPEGVHGPSMVIDPADFRWSDEGWQRPSLRDMVIYELHVGTFTPEGTFLAALEKLRHVRELGANVIELMPVGEFAGTRNWGYDGVNIYAPSRAYGSPDDLRRFVDEAHRWGLAVVLDVVYNHFGPDGNYLGAYIGGRVNQAVKSVWGDSLNYGHPDLKPLREAVIANPPYWREEFHIDGFRIDATHAVFDESPTHILKELTEAVHGAGGFAIAEDPRNEVSLVMPVAAGGFGFDAVWADDFHHVIAVGATGERPGFFIDYQGSNDELADLLAHGWLYRGQTAESSGTPRGTDCGIALPEGFVHALSNHDQVGNRACGERFSHLVTPELRRAAAVLLCLSPYTPLLFAGQEWGSTSRFLYFTDHEAELGKAVTEGRSAEFNHLKEFQDPEHRDKIPDPQAESTFMQSKLSWGDLSQPDHALTLKLYQECLSLRNSNNIFRPRDRESWHVAKLGLDVVALRFHSEDGGWLVVYDPKGGHGGCLASDEFCQGPRWELVLSSEDERFGGDNRNGFDDGRQEFRLESAGALVFKAARNP